MPIDAACSRDHPEVGGPRDLFNGTCFGWRIAPYNVLLALGLQDRGLQADCDLDLYGDAIDASPGPPPEGHPTDLDIIFATMPSGAKIDHLAKWACGNRGFSDSLTLTLDVGAISVDRWLHGRPSIETEAVDGSVTACAVRSQPAICIDYALDDELHAYSAAQVIVIEDGTFDPNAVVLRLWSDEVDLATLRDIAGSVVPR